MSAGCARSVIDAAVGLSTASPAPSVEWKHMCCSSLSSRKCGWAHATGAAVAVWAPIAQQVLAEWAYTGSGCMISMRSAAAVCGGNRPSEWSKVLNTAPHIVCGFRAGAGQQPRLLCACASTLRRGPWFGILSVGLLRKRDLMGRARILSVHCHWRCCRLALLLHLVLPQLTVLATAVVLGPAVCQTGCSL